MAQNLGKTLCKCNLAHSMINWNGMSISWNICLHEEHVLYEYLIKHSLEEKHLFVEVFMEPP